MADMKQFLEILEEVNSYREDNCFSSMIEIVDSLGSDFELQTDDSKHFKEHYVYQETITAGESGVVGYRGKQALKLPDGRFLVWNFEIGV